MTMLNSRGTERSALIGVITPGSKAVGVYTTSYFALKNFARLEAMIQSGTLGTAATLDAKFTAYTDAAGSNPLDVPGAAITQMTKANTDDNKQSFINVAVGHIPHGLPYAFGRVTITVAGAASDAAVLVMGLDARYESAAVYNLASVKEIVSA